MSTVEPEPVDTGGTVYDDPNREAVGLDPCWVEGTGGVPGDPQPKTDDDTTAGSDDDLEAMTKADLLELAKSEGVSPANNDMTKAELVDAIRAARG